MTYLQFHAVFILPPIILLAWICARKWVSIQTGRHPVRAVVVIMAAALMYTTLWDNYLVYRGVWSYGADRVVATIGFVPIEEYLFFLLQPVLTSLFFYSQLGKAGPPSKQRYGGRTIRLAGAAVFAALFFVGVGLLLGDESGVYLGLILAWCSPVMVLQWGLGGDVLWSHAPTIGLGILGPTLYLWVADGVAISLGIWEIAESTTLGWSFLGILPVEEAAFFLATNVMVVFGVALLLPIRRPERDLINRPIWPERQPPE